MTYQNKSVENNNPFLNGCQSFVLDLTVKLRVWSMWTLKQEETNDHHVNKSVVSFEEADEFLQGALDLQHSCTKPIDGEHVLLYIDC